MLYIYKTSIEIIKCRVQSTHESEGEGEGETLLVGLFGTILRVNTRANIL